MCARSINLRRINRDCSTLVRRQLNWSVIAVIFGAAAVAAGFAAGAAALDSSPISNGAIHVSLPEVNRVAKRDRLRFSIPDYLGGIAIKRDAKDKDSGSSLRSRAPRETETKAVMYCEPVGSPLAGPAVRKMPPRSCLARHGKLPQYTLLGLITLQVS
jgi:hypothetical protein